MTAKDELYTRAKAALVRGEEAQWEAAECMAQLYELGEAQREIAERLGCSQSTVRRYLAVERESSGLKKRPSFTEAMAEVRTDNENRVNLPKAPEARAAFVADLLKDKAVADAPEVRQVQERHATRRLRQEMADFNREHDIATRTEKDREWRRVSAVHNDVFWFGLLSNVKTATRTLADATSELERTGLPRSLSGEVIKANRALVRAAERFDEAAAKAGIGSAMNN